MRELQRGNLRYRQRRATRQAAGGVLAVWMTAVIAVTAAAQPSDRAGARFVKFLGSQTYTQLIAKRALDTDLEMPPTCKNRQVMKRRFIYLFRRPQFISSREVPVAGEWLVRVTVRRCGRMVEHNMFVRASRVRGLVVQPGYPGTTLLLPKSQVRVGKAVIRRTLRARRGCRRVDVVETRVTTPPRRGDLRWTETWITWACGRRYRHTLSLTRRRGGATDFSIR